MVIELSLIIVLAVMVVALNGILVWQTILFRNSFLTLVRTGFLQEKSKSVHEYVLAERTLNPIKLKPELQEELEETGYSGIAGLPAGGLT